MMSDKKEKKEKEEKNPGGRPPLFDSVEELEKKINEYFLNCPDKKTLVFFDKNSGNTIEHQVDTPTVTGLALYLGFCDRHSFYDYEKNEKFSHTIKKARLRIENEYEKQLWNSACPGAIFALKNFGWKDKTEQDINLSSPNINIKGLNI